jgi:DNA polymerase-1
MKVAGWDIEATGLRPYHGDEVVSAAVSIAGGEWWTEVYHHESFKGEQFKPSPEMEAILYDPEWTIVGHNLLFDIPFWEHYFGREIQAKPFDTLVAQSLIDESIQPNSLANLSKIYLEYEYPEEDKKKRKSVFTQPLGWLEKYNRMDAENSMKLWHVFHPLLALEWKDAMFADLMTSLRTLGRMQGKGVKLDIDYLLDEWDDIEADFEDLEHKFDCMEFNPRSPKQLGEKLYDYLSLPILSTSKKSGAPSTDVETLKKLRAHFATTEEQQQFLDDILQHRLFSKKIGTYFKPLLEEHRALDGRIHGRYHLGRSSYGGTVTGRLSSSEPNLQNIPRDPTIKGCFIPSAGHRLFDADYAQLELRVAGFLSNDPVMQAAFAEGRDMHTDALAGVLGQRYSTVVSKLESHDPAIVRQRTAIKSVNFGILYGAQAPTIVGQLAQLGVEMTRAEVQLLMDEWHKNYSVFTKWEAGVRQSIYNGDKLVSPLMRTRSLAADSQWGRQFRQGVNFLIQSFASDLMVLSLPILEEELGDRGTILMTVHDSVVGEYVEPDGQYVCDTVVWALTDGVCGRLAEIHDIDTAELYLDVDVEMDKVRWGV